MTERRWSLQHPTNDQFHTTTFRVFKDSTQGWHRAHNLVPIDFTYQRTTEEGHLFTKGTESRIIPELDTDTLRVNRLFLISQGLWLQEP